MINGYCVKKYVKMNWETARKIFLSTISTDRNMYFRGQSNSEWGLELSLGRLSKKLAKQLKLNSGSQQFIEFTERLENDLLNEFEQSYHRISGAPSLPN